MDELNILQVQVSSIQLLYQVQVWPQVQSFFRTVILQKKNPPWPQQLRHFLKWTAESFPARFSPALPTLEINGTFPSGGEVWGRERETKGLPVIPATFVAPPPFQTPTGTANWIQRLCRCYERPQVTASHQPGWVSPELGLLVTQEATLETFPPPPPPRRRMSSHFNSQPRLLFLACTCSPYSADPTHGGFSSSLGTGRTDRRRKKERLSSSPQVLVSSLFQRFRLSHRNVSSDPVTADGST